MGANLKMVLSSLRDVDGIVGSFVVNSDGDLVAEDLPAYFAGVAEQVAPRAVRLRDALSLTEGSVSACTIRYADHKLSLRSVHGALLAVVASQGVNAPALRMAMNLVARKCSPEELASASFTLNPPAVAENTGAANSAGSAGASSGLQPTAGAAAAHQPPPPPRPSMGAMPPPPSARGVVGASTMPSVPSPVTVPATPAARSDAPPAAPTPERGDAPADADHAEGTRRSRVTYFRGKRVDG